MLENWADLLVASLENDRRRKCAVGGAPHPGDRRNLRSGENAKSESYSVIRNSRDEEVCLG